MSIHLQRGGAKLQLLLLVLAIVCRIANADERPALAIIIDDMGNHQAQGMAALMLPGAVTYAFLPHTPYAVQLAERAHALGKEVMLHLPMDAAEGNTLGPGALRLYMSEAEFKQTLIDNLAAVPHVVGLNNHMGSLLTQHPGAMAWMMETLLERPRYYFVDSRTTRDTVAQLVAAEYGIRNTRRDVFLDNEIETEAIEQQLMLLLQRAQERGSAVGIGHPYPQTVLVLQRFLDNLNSSGVQLITTSALIDLQQRRRRWPEPSSPLLKVAKSSKR